MRDRLFSGADVEEALATAAASLGLPKAELRYVVLDEGTSGGRGLKPTPARIAVLIHENSEGGRVRPATGHRASSPGTPPAEPEADPRARLQALVRAVADAGSLELEAQLEESEEALVLHLRGGGSSFFHGEDGRGAPLLAFEHLLQRACGRALYPRMLRVRCEGFRERRDQALAEEARELADAVRADGQPRTMEPLNAYERRIVHLALQDVPGITTFSVGEGRDRHVTVAPSEAAPASAGDTSTEPGSDAGDADDGR